MIDRGYLSNDYIQDLHPSEYERELDLYNRLLKHSPRLREFLDTLHEMKDYDGVEDVGKMLQRIASQAKSSDAHEVSTRIIGYIPRTPSDDDRLIPPIDAKNKDLRGLNHPDIAALLAPRDLHKHLFLPRTDKRYKRAVAKMMKKKINLYSLHLPKFLYGRYVPGNSFAGLSTTRSCFVQVRHAAWQQDVFRQWNIELFGCASGRGRHRGSDDDGAMPGEGAAIAALLNRASSPDEDEEEEDDDDDDDFFSAKRALDGEDDDDDLYYDPDGTPHRRPRKDGADNDNGGERPRKRARTANDGNTDA
ncbi:hypothetical protein AAF712_006336 [Marasmius tenuissimus]|uniref:Uncharacterized protein n=1 Tax=Marasmius tenuissimus TaxID=585030 RepID=A0ABR2ZYP6_9AGAR